MTSYPMPIESNVRGKLVLQAKFTIGLTAGEWRAGSTNWHDFLKDL